jgi:branched-subunit amino acid ABC-type transport system permease component
MGLLTTLLEGVLYGTSLGMLYVLVALGLTLIFGLMDVINFAHGAFVTLGAYLGISTIAFTGNFWLALLVAGLAVGLLGVVIERSLLVRLYGAPPIFQLLLTFGVALVVEGLIILSYGQDNQRVETPALLQGDPIAIGPALLPKYRLFIIVFTGILVALIWFGIQRTKLGLIIKAGIEDRERTELLGIRLSRINMLIMGIGSGLAAISGILAGPLLGADPHLGTGLLITSFVIVVIGGLGNIRGTIVAGLLVGVLYSIVSFTIPSIADPSIFVVMAGVLLLRPQGLFGSVEA